MKIARATCLAMFAAIGPASAHHSYAMFDGSKTDTLEGTVKAFEWINPHAWIHIAVVNAQGAPEEWAFEMASIGQLAARGWARDTVKPGDHVSITYHPMRDGSHGGSQLAVKLANGTVMGGLGYGGGR